MRIEKWPLPRKLHLLGIAALIMVIADALTSGLLNAFGVGIEPAFSVMSGLMALLVTLGFLWAANPREMRHLVILCGGVFAATGAALAATALVTHGLTPDTMNFEQREGFWLSVLAAAAAWGLVYWLTRRHGIWTLPSRKGTKD